MHITQMILPLLLVPLLVPVIEGHVYACDKLKHMITNSITIANLPYLCVVPKEEFSNWSMLEKMQARSGNTSTSFATLAKRSDYCVKRGNNSPWSITADSPLDLDCSTNPFTVVVTADEPWIDRPNKQYLWRNRLSLSSAKDLIIVSPPAGIWLQKDRCIGAGNITVFAGAGTRDSDERHKLQSWPCNSMPSYIISFDVALTFHMDGDATYHFITTHNLGEPFNLNADRHVFVLSSGRSDNLPNRIGITQQLHFNVNEPYKVRQEIEVNMNLNFDPKNIRIADDGQMEGSKVELLKEGNGPFETFYNGSYTESFNAHSFKIAYKPVVWETELGRETDLWRSQDAVNIKIIPFTNDRQPSSSTNKPSTTTTIPTTTTPVRSTPRPSTKVVSTTSPPMSTSSPTIPSTPPPTSNCPEVAPYIIFAVMCTLVNACVFIFTCRRIPRALELRDLRKRKLSTRTNSYEGIALTTANSRY